MRHVAAVTLLLLARTAAAGPALISHQGRLTDGEDKPVTGSHDITVRFYPPAVQGQTETALWEETYAVHSITPRLATSTLLVELVAWVSETSNHSDQLVAAIFRDSQADAIAAGYADLSHNNVAYGGGVNNYTDTPTVVRVRVPSNATSQTTFKFRAGCNNGAARINGIGNQRYLGGSMKTTFTVTEIAP